MGKDVIIALDFDSREKTLAFLDRFQEEKPFVNIMLCDIDCDREVTLTENASGKEFVQVTTGLILHIYLNIRRCRVTRDHRRSEEQYLCFFDNLLCTHI